MEADDAILISNVLLLGLTKFPISAINSRQLNGIVGRKLN